MLASRYNPRDELAAEFIRTFRSAFFHGHLYVARFDALAKKTNQTWHFKLPKASAGKEITDEVSLYGLRGTHPLLLSLSPWEFVQWWKPHYLRAPSKTYRLTLWINRPKPDEPCFPGVHYVLDEAHCKRSGSNLMQFPVRKGLADAAQASYETFRSSWILIRRSKPVVPCPEQTPLPSRKMSKELRSKLFSIYLRPWTLVPAEATAEVPYILDLNLTLTAWESFRDTEKTDVHRNMRNAWKEYFLTRVPAAFASQVQNFVRAAFAENHNKNEDDEEGRARKLDAIVCSVTCDNIQDILNKACEKITSTLDGDGEERASRKMQAATHTAANLIELQGRIPSVTPGTMLESAPCSLYKYDAKAMLQTKTIHDSEDDHVSEVQVSKHDWHTAYLEWRYALENQSEKTPYDLQWKALDAVHRRCIVEHTEVETMSDDTSQPLFRMVHGLPGSGKTQLMHWIRDYLDTVWHMREDVHFKFLAPQNTMAANIGGATIHSFGEIQFKDKKGRVLKLSDIKKRKTLLILKSLI